MVAQPVVEITQHSIDEVQILLYLLSAMGGAFILVLLYVWKGYTKSIERNAAELVISKEKQSQELKAVSDAQLMAFKEINQTLKENGRTMSDIRDEMISIKLEIKSDLAKHETRISLVERDIRNIPKRVTD